MTDDKDKIITKADLERVGAELKQRVTTEASKSRKLQRVALFTRWFFGLLVLGHVSMLVYYSWWVLPAHRDFMSRNVQEVQKLNTALENSVQRAEAVAAQNKNNLDRLKFPEVEPEP